MSTGTPVFDSLKVLELWVDVLQSSMQCKAAFVNTKTGHTHGWTEGRGTMWSKETKKRLDALKESMEMDLMKVHFSGASEPAKSPGLQVSGGIKEHLEDDAPPV
jgi:hypothetical protein